MRSPSVQGARRSAPHFLNDAGVLLRVQPNRFVFRLYRKQQRPALGTRPGKYVEHGEQAQRSNGGPIACFDCQVSMAKDGYFKTSDGFRIHYVEEGQGSPVILIQGLQR